MFLTVLGEKNILSAMQKYCNNSYIFVQRLKPTHFTFGLESCFYGTGLKELCKIGFQAL